MGDELYRTVKIKLNRKGETDSGGQTVGTNPSEETEFELVSTMMLKQILESDDDQKKDQIRGLADEEDGVLACSTQSDGFEILLNNELEAAIKGANVPELPGTARGYELERVDESDEDEDLSLVSTQMLRRMLHVEEESDAAPEDEGGAEGYNPYDRA